jgi:hypothetical protein
MVYWDKFWRRIEESLSKFQIFIHHKNETFNVRLCWMIHNRQLEKRTKRSSVNSPTRWNLILDILQIVLVITANAKVR